MLMNSAFVLEASQRFAQRLRREAGAQLTDQVTLAWRLAFAVPPSDEQVAQAVTFIEAQTEHFAAHPVAATKNQPAVEPDAEALASFCHALLSSNPFLYVD